MVDSCSPTSGPQPNRKDLTTRAGRELAAGAGHEHAGRGCARWPVIGFEKLHFGIEHPEKLDVPLETTIA